jgi:hypothetical protein
VPLSSTGSYLKSALVARLALCELSKHVAVSSQKNGYVSAYAKPRISA